MSTRVYLLISLLVVALVVSLAQRVTIAHLKMTLAARPRQGPPPANLEPLRQQNRQLAEVEQMRAASRELPQLRAQLALLKATHDALPGRAAAEDEASLTENDKLLRRWKTLGPNALAREDLQTLVRILKDPALYSKIESNEWLDLRLLDASRRALVVAEVVPALTSALSHEDQWSRWSAAQFLMLFGPDATGAVPALIEALEKRQGADWGLQMHAASALGSIGPEARAAVPALINALGSDQAAVRTTACLGLEGIGADSLAAVPQLVKLLRDEDEFVRARAEAALRKIAPDALRTARSGE